MARSKSWYAIVWPYGVLAYDTEVGKPTVWRLATEAARDEFVAGGPPGRRDCGYREAITGAEVRDRGLHPVPAEAMDARGRDNQPGREPGEEQGDGKQNDRVAPPNRTLQTAPCSSGP